jgi:hypothetical protein
MAAKMRRRKRRKKKRPQLAKWMSWSSGNTDDYTYPCIVEQDWLVVGDDGGRSR